ncbi:peptide deformylase [Shimia marina]|uniref:Peptide deformylase n=1 Tax=Shimia marina TaxID=321267 RepID=A0A0N7LSL3_9RHOB|nr:peptide deformylase [Shimia marina]CUH53940.1 Peptide deformylase [Shimia marina]SFE18705.1 peptide deformylase [Shimia marina]
MSVLPLVFYPDARLSEVCAPVNDEDLRRLIADMFDTMYAAPGRGLAGPQVGVMKRLFVMDCTWKEGTRTPMAFLNPEIITQSETVESLEEGCLSIPNLMVPVIRPTGITVRWTDELGRAHERDFDSFEARCIQHEMDHLAGRVTLDHLSETARTEILQGYTSP